MFDFDAWRKNLSDRLSVRSVMVIVILVLFLNFELLKALVIIEIFCFKPGEQPINMRFFSQNASEKDLHLHPLNFSGLHTNKNTLLALKRKSQSRLSLNSPSIVVSSTNFLVTSS